jgi:hypothetical protein
MWPVAANRRLRVRDAGIPSTQPRHDDSDQLPRGSVAGLSPGLCGRSDPRHIVKIAVQGFGWPEEGIMRRAALMCPGTGNCKSARSACRLAGGSALVTAGADRSPGRHRGDYRSTKWSAIAATAWPLANVSHRDSAASPGDHSGGVPPRAASRPDAPEPRRNRLGALCW